MKVLTIKSTCGKLAAFAIAASVAIPSLADTYAYKVQYLQSSGVQYIDTGVIPTANTMFKGTYEYMSSSSTGETCDMIAGCNYPGYYPASLNGTTDVKKERHVYGSTSGNKLNYDEPYRTCHYIVFNDPQHRVFKDGKCLGKFTATFGTNQRNCHLFAANTANGSGTARYFANARIYWCELIDNMTGEVLRRFIPVVDENGKPAMFDEINEKLYYNKGTGADFTAGPQITEEPWYFVEYLESTGTQWIDTEVLALSQTRTDVGYKYTPTTQSSNAMIGGIQSPSRYYPVSLQQGTDAKAERYDRGGNAGSEFQLTHPVVTDHEVIFNGAQRNVYVDGVDIGTFTSSYTDSTLSMYMFAARNVNGNKADWLAKARIYHYEIYHTNGTMCAAFRPAVDSTGKGCMYNGYTGKLHKNGGTGDFNVGRIISPEVPLNLDSRSITPSDGLNVFPFSVRPSYGTVFKLDEAYTNAFDVEVRSDGVYTVAKGTGSAAADVIVVTGNTAANFAVGAMPTCASIVLSGTVTLTADCDWRGLGTIIIPDGVTIDLNGHNLQTVGFKTLPNTFAMITDSTSGNGALRVEVAANEMFMNDSIPLMGSLKLVKEGAGLYLAELANQQYTGGTEVVGGRLTFVTDQYPLGPKNAVVKVGPGAVCDLGGRHNVNTCVYNYDLAGTLRMSTKARANGYNAAYKILGTTFSLSGNATIEGEGFYFASASTSPLTLALNGYDLTFNVQDINSSTRGYIGMGAFNDNGSGGRLIVVHGETEWLGGSGFDRSVAVEYRSPAFYRVSNSDVKFYDFTHDCGWWSYGYSFKVKLYGTYHAGSIRPPIEVQSGATLDLAALNAPLNASAVANTSGAMTFVSGTAETPSVVNVALAGRTDLRTLAKSANPYVVTWSSQPTNVEFVLDAQSKADGYRIYPEAGGLRLKRITGFMILVR